MGTPEDLPKAEEKARLENTQEARLTATEKRLDKLAAKLLEHERLLGLIGQELLRHRNALIQLHQANDPSRPRIFIPRA